VHAGLLNGVSAIPSVSNGKARFDLAALAESVSVGGSGQVAFVTGPGRAAKLAVLMPELKSMVLPSLAVAETRVIAVDPLSLAHGVGSQPEINSSTSAVLHMDDNPDPIVASGVMANPVRSLWQTDAIALNCLIDIAFRKRRAGAVAFMDIPGINDWTDL
jgi:hypothetical protein